MLKRIITAIAIVACVLPPLLFGGVLNHLLVAVFVILGGFELFSLLPAYKKSSKLIFLLPLLCAYAMMFVEVEIAFALLAILLLVFLAIPVFTTTFSANDALMAGAIVVMMYTFGHAFLEIYALDPLYIWFILVATYATDTGAYFSGVFFGKHKLCERISPKKTIEGSIGGILFSWILSILFAIFVFKDASYPLLIAAGLLIPFVSQIGDLSFSSIKRLYNVKDFSNIFPGHGGIMDRIDSLVFDLILFYALMVVIL